MAFYPCYAQLEKVRVTSLYDSDFVAHKIKGLGTAGPVIQKQTCLVKLQNNTGVNICGHCKRLTLQDSADKPRAKQH